jgi:hypothetical protein
VGLVPLVTAQNPSLNGHIPDLKFQVELSGNIARRVYEETTLTQQISSLLQKLNRCSFT